MSKFTLVKISAPGWEKDFDSRKSAQAELYKYICSACCKQDCITKSSKIEEMLATACGCEFDLEEN